ncbi:MAG: winged helix-turn-helix transcriptional regulator, partial [Muribaculaceae bacterium]|nr:winged helix-turn-helix transcriptional regulator [Muribaculaceae bacterium]
KLRDEDRRICRRIYAEGPPRVEYSLTAKGQSLMPILRSLIDWALTHREN